MGTHHDDSFLWNSQLYKWNAVNYEPHRDVVGDWQRNAKKQGLPFGVSEHLGASFTWFQDSHKSDKTGAAQMTASCSGFLSRDKVRHLRKTHLRANEAVISDECVAEQRNEQGHGHAMAYLEHESHDGGEDRPADNCHDDD